VGLGGEFECGLQGAVFDDGTLAKPGRVHCALSRLSSLLGVEGANPRAAFSTKIPVKCRAFSFQLPEELDCWKVGFGKRVEMPEHSQASIF